MRFTKVSQAGDRASALSRGAASLLLGDAAIAAWLWYALRRFTDTGASVWPSVAFPLVATVFVSLALMLARRKSSRAGWIFLRSLLLGACITALGWAASRRLGITQGEALWLGAAVGSLSWLQRALYLGALRRGCGGFAEVVRWVVVGLAGTLAVRPFYHNGDLGSGDAQWYAIMIGDFVTQSRAGVFPVWVGQSFYAFNGAVSPLRYAPGILFMGGILDFLTAQSLHMVALRNLVLSSCALLGAYSAYACLRPILKGAPWIACGLAVLWVYCPGVLAPPMLGDLYMTFSTLPFVPLVLHGCWRVWERDDRWGRLWIAAGLAGVWLCHSPIAIWFTMVASGLYLASMVGRPLRRQLGLGMATSAAFLALGSLPFISVLTLDNQLKAEGSSAVALENIHECFPANFKPIDPRLLGLESEQVGYALLGALALAVVCLPFVRQRGAWAFAAACLGVAAFAIPLPRITDALWLHMPSWFIVIQNVWPVQRLFLVWSAVIVFTAAIVMASPRVSGRRGAYLALCLAFACGIAWSVREANKIHQGILPRRGSAATAEMREGENNLVLTRYAYSSFSAIPQYFSHAYMDPLFENRLLDIDTQLPLATNADAAAPVAGDSDAPAGAHLVQSGVWTGHSVTQSPHYRLLPALTLEPGLRYALRLEFDEPGVEGTLQILSDSLFREYTLPDSGVGSGARPRPLSFGSLPQSSHVVPLSITGKAPAPLLSTFIVRRYTTETIPFARFWLYSFEPERLPVAVESLVPYRARVNTPHAAYLETPRLWLKGWKATVNGIPADTLRSSENLVMLPVPAGTCRVELTYVPPRALVASFWIAAAGWSSLCVFGLVQLALWSAGRTLRLRGLEAGLRARALFVAMGAVARNAAHWLWRHKAPVAVAVLAVTAFLLAGRLRSRRHVPVPASTAAAGPLQLHFKRPSSPPSTPLPLLSTGHVGAGTVISVLFIDPQKARLYADVWGTLFMSEPVSIDSHRMNSLVVSDSALFPQDAPEVRTLSPNERSRLRANLTVELNGTPVIQASTNAFETTPKELRIGESQFGTLVGMTYPGELGTVRRLPIPRMVPLPSGHHAHLKIRFADGRFDESEPIASVSVGAEQRLCYVTYVYTGSLRVGVWAPGDTRGHSKEVAYDPAADHDIDLSVSHTPNGLALSCSFDGKHLFGEEGTACDLPPVITTGVNVAGAPGFPARFTGQQLDLEIVPNSARPEAAVIQGPEHLVVTLPLGRLGRREPLLTTGRTGAGDIVYVVYDDPSHVRIGFDHWGYGGQLSEPITVDYRVPHEIWISSPTLLASADRAADMRPHPASMLTVRFDGSDVLSIKVATYPAGPGEVTVASNKIGASTCDEEFTGIVKFAERSSPATSRGGGR
jgi:hypothetical protein